MSEEPSYKAILSQGQSVFGKQTGAVLANLLMGRCRDINGVLSATICCQAVSSAENGSFFSPFLPGVWTVTDDNEITPHGI